MGCADRTETMESLAALSQMAAHIAGGVDSLKANLKKVIPRPVNWSQYQASATTIDTETQPIQTSNVILIHRIRYIVSSPATLTYTTMAGPVIEPLNAGGPPLIFAETSGSGLLFRSTDWMKLVQNSAGILLLQIIGEELPDGNMW